MAIEFLDTSPVVENDLLRTLFTYWLGKVKGMTPPRRQEIDPVDIPRLLPYVWIHEHLPRTTEFRCRLVGEEVNQRYASNTVGRLCRDVIGDQAWALVSEQYMLAINTPGIGHSIGPVYMHTIERQGVGERIFMPLRNDDGENEFILGATVYTSSAEATDSQPNITPRKTFTPLSVLIADTGSEK